MFKSEQAVLSSSKSGISKVKVTFWLPSKETEPSTSPLTVIVLAVVNLSAFAAFKQTRLEVPLAVAVSI